MKIYNIQGQYHIEIVICYRHDLKFQKAQISSHCTKWRVVYDSHNPYWRIVVNRRIMTENSKHYLTKTKHKFYHLKIISVTLIRNIQS